MIRPQAPSPDLSVVAAWTGSDVCVGAAGAVAPLGDQGDEGSGEGDRGGDQEGVVHPGRRRWRG